MAGTAPPPDDEYAVIELGSSLPVFSLLFFLAAMGSRFLVALLPGELVDWLFGGGLRYFPRRPLLSAAAVPVFALLGLVLGLIGLANHQARSLARVGVFLNAVALLLSLLLVAAFFWILPD